MITWTLLLAIALSAILAIAWVEAIDRADIRRARQRAGLPVIGRDERVPRAVAIPTVHRRGRKDVWS